MKTKLVKISSFFIQGTSWQRPEHWKFKGVSHINHRLYENEIFMGENGQQYYDRDAQCWDTLVEYNHFEVPYDEVVEMVHLAYDEDGKRLSTASEQKFLDRRKEERDAQR